MYPQQQGYPQAGFAVPGGYQQQSGGYPGYPPQGGYPQSGYQQPGYPQTGPSVNLNLGPANSSGYGGDSSAWAPDPAGLFAEKAIRQAFVSKVYSILTVQLVFTTILIGLFISNEETKAYFKRSPGWLYLGMAIFFISYLVLVCIESARRSAPLNFILLSVLTFGYGLVAAVFSCQYKTNVVLLAFLATAISCFLVAAFAKSTKFDITNCGTTLCLLGLAHMVIGIVLILVFPARMASLLMAISGAFLTSLYLMYDMQLILGGRKCELSPEEYILGAIMLYTDIIQMFIYMLEIMNRISGD